MDKIFMGKQLRRARTTRGLSQAQLAEKTGYACNYIGLIERGISTPSLPTIIAISNVLGVNLDYLIGTHIEKERDPECEVYENEIKGKIKKFNKQQLLCLLDVLELLQKYGRGDDELNE